jgi:hypothetical protein
LLGSSFQQGMYLLPWVSNLPMATATSFSHLTTATIKSKLLYDWRSVSQDGSVICSVICQWSESQRTHNHTLLSHLRLLGSLSVALTSRRDYGGSILARLHTGSNYQLHYSSLYSLSTDHSENVFSIIARSLIAGETTCPQSSSLAMAVVLSPVYTAVTWQWICMSQYDVVQWLI